MCQAAVKRSQRPICSFIVMFSGRYGSISGRGLVCLVWIPLNLIDHFSQFIHYTGSSKSRRSFLQLLWLLCVWLIWGERNNRIFNNVETPIITLRLCMALRVGGRTLCGVCASTDHSLVYILYDSFLVGVFSKVRLVLMRVHRLC